jgi:hypothetical protein
MFKFYTNTLKTIKEDNVRYIVGKASSTSIDRDDDRMSEAALHTMKATAEANLTIFTNHEYRVPDDLFGSCVEAKVNAKKDAQPIVVKSEDGETEIATFHPQELEVRIKVVSDEVNPKAGKLYKAIEEGVALGFSIGGEVKKIMKVLDETTQKVYNLIDSIDLYEISVVGIPANADAMNLAIAKSLDSKKIEIVDDKKQVEEILSKLKKSVEYTWEGVRDFLHKELKGYYDEAYPSEVGTMMSPADKAKQEAEYEEEDMQRAKAQAENVLLRANMDAKVADSDEHEIHLRSHSYEMESMIYNGTDTTKMAAHITTHLKKLQKEIDAAETEVEQNG